MDELRKLMNRMYAPDLVEDRINEIEGGDDEEKDDEYEEADEAGDGK